MQTVVLRQEIGASTDTTWRAVTEPGGLAAWLGRHQGPPLQHGARFDLWHDGVVRSQHEIVEWLPDRLIAMTWNIPGEAPSLVRIRIEPADVAAVVVLEHEGVEDVQSYTAGWRVHLAYLAGYLAGRPRSFDHFWSDYEAQLNAAERSPR